MHVDNVLIITIHMFISGKSPVGRVVPESDVGWENSTF